MKKIIYLIIVFSFIFVSCSTSNPSTQNDTKIAYVYAMTGEPLDTIENVFNIYQTSGRDFVTLLQANGNTIRITSKSTIIILK